MFDELITLNEADFSVSFSTLPSNILGDLPMFFSLFHWRITVQIIFSFPALHDKSL